MKLNDTIADFLELLRGTSETLRGRKMAETTVKVYGYYARTLLDHFGQQATVGELTSPALQRFLTAYAAGSYNPQKKPVCNNTVGSAHAAITKYCDYLERRGLLLSNPMLDIEKAPREQGARPVPDIEKVRQCLHICDNLFPLKRALLAKLVFSMLWNTGVRRCELLGMCLPDLDIPNTRILLRKTKGNRQRYAELNSAVMRDLKAYLAIRGDVETDALFVNRSKALGSQGLTALIEEVKTVAGYRNDKTILPHGIRHCAATALNDAGVELQDTSKLLGHSDTKTTEIYVQDRIERRKRTAEILAMLINGSAEAVVAAQNVVASRSQPISPHRRRIQTRR